MTESTLLEAAIFLGLVAVIAVAGVVVGMLIAPRLARLTEAHDEEAGGDDD